jgi:D-arabinose 1-dehydrogenase-like Zn-dependent alcohol dehydrogenase
MVSDYIRWLYSDILPIKLSVSAHQMMKVVEKHNIRSQVSVLTLEDAQSIPDRYMRPDLKGRLVVTL